MARPGRTTFLARNLSLGQKIRNERFRKQSEDAAAFDRETARWKAKGYVIAEGELDCMSLHAQGVKAVVLYHGAVTGRARKEDDNG